MTPETLRKWVRQAERDGDRRPGLSTEERERLRGLEKENKELRRANEILKAASANSSGRCNDGLKSISRSLVTECLARSRVEPQGNRVKASLTVA